MRGTWGRGDPGGNPEVARRHELALPWHKVDDLNAPQLAAMQAVDEARMAGVLSEEQAERLFTMVRGGQVAGARKRLTQARKAARS